MKRFLVLSKNTGQTMSFKRVVLEYTKKNEIPVKWLFGTTQDYLEIIEREKIALVLISPEVMLVEKRVRTELELRGIEAYTMKPVDFGLKRMEKIFPILESYIYN